MIQLFKKANDKSGLEKEKDGYQNGKGNALFVQIENEMVSLSDLAKFGKENDYTPLPEKVENEMEIDGVTHNISDLISLYKNKKKNMTDKEDPALKAAKKGMPKTNEEGKGRDPLEKENEKEEDEEKENELAIAKDNPDEVEAKAKKMSSKKNKEDEEEDDEKENEKSEEDDVEDKIAKSNKANKKDVKHFVRLNSMRENGSIVDNVTIDTMHNRIDRGKSTYGTAK